MIKVHSLQIGESVYLKAIAEVVYHLGKKSNRYTYRRAVVKNRFEDDLVLKFNDRYFHAEKSQVRIEEGYYVLEVDW